MLASSHRTPCPWNLQHSHVWDPGPSFPTCPRLRTAPSQTLFEQLSMKVALSLAWARSTRCTRSDWNWDPFLIYDLIYWICSLNFIDFQPMIEKTNWTIGSLPKDDAFTAIFWIWIWWHIKIILQASECLYIYMLHFIHHDAVAWKIQQLPLDITIRSKIYTHVGILYIHAACVSRFCKWHTPCRRHTCGAMQHLDLWRNSLN